jgi:hypothetical protein
VRGGTRLGQRVLHCLVKPQLLGAEPDLFEFVRWHGSLFSSVDQGWLQAAHDDVQVMSVLATSMHVLQLHYIKHPALDCGSLEPYRHAHILERGNSMF